MATFVRYAGERRLVIKSRDEELVVLAAAPLRDVPLKTGDLLRFDRTAWVAYERIERPARRRVFPGRDSRPRPSTAWADWTVKSRT